MSLLIPFPPATVTSFHVWNCICIRCLLQVPVSAPKPQPAETLLINQCITTSKGDHFQVGGNFYDGFYPTERLLLLHGDCQLSSAIGGRWTHAAQAGTISSNLCWRSFHAACTNTSAAPVIRTLRHSFPPSRRDAADTACPQCGAAKTARKISLMAHPVSQRRHPIRRRIRAVSLRRSRRMLRRSLRDGLNKYAP